MRFPVVLHSDDGMRFGVTVPDLPGCFSAGDSFDEALDAVLEAIDLHLEGLTEDGQEIPIPGSIAEHRTHPDFADGVWGVVDVHGATRSGFLADAARAAMYSQVQSASDRRKRP
ncbi:MAG: type II toxin-antitoxin system HicB family antitoxin [Lamprobacter sp.]|uniref:type II toxin-antitoxin system HicB family antitoxin n=1 Tax=Lamprobacter sp. TaxID=3100796 RepID=UPI002B2572A6|nr:type II toxin-antitoxin system HicB family antitoxin [Lamprobacter sp.]MEA3640748.1 type II toxin-antitoxin system HicB family antitoxin [Lamprobacter sp.]